MSIQYGDILSGMSPISLDQMECVRLLNRIDTKYLTDTKTLSKILERAAEMGYYVFEDDGSRMLEYKTMYYDTPGLRMYLDHHNRRLVRQKLRTRCYVASGVTFLELKSKNNHGRTRKKRMEVSAEKYLQTSFDDPEQLAWLSGRLSYPVDEMKASLETLFSRITLVNPEFTERTTIDMNLFFRNMRTGKCSDMGPLSVIEVKQDSNRTSPVRDILLELRVKPVRISKYCIGTAMTSDGIKSGRFKKKIMLINKMKLTYDSSSNFQSS